MASVHFLMIPSVLVDTMNRRRSVIKIEEVDYTQNAKPLISYLNERGYPCNCIKSNKYSYEEETFTRIEVYDRNCERKNKAYIIQAFIIMPKDIKQRRKEYPYYRKYNQKKPFGTEVNPACAIAIQEEDDKDWSFCSAGDLTEEYTKSSFINYSLAKQRFNRRFGKRLIVTIKTILYSALLLGLAYLVLAIISINGGLKGIKLPFDGAFVTFFGLIAILALLPTIFPYIKGLKLPGFGVEVKEHTNHGKR